MANIFGQPVTSIGSEASQKKNLKEMDDPFGMRPSPLAPGGMSINLGGEDNSMSQKEADARLKELANRKAISSEDFINYAPE